MTETESSRGLSSGRLLLLCNYDENYIVSGPGVLAFGGTLVRTVLALLA